MSRYFNVAGPCYPGEHYMLPALARLEGLPFLVERGQYFVIHAARQSGKTTLLLSLARQLNAGEKFHALYCSLETAQGFNEPHEGMRAIVSALRRAVEFHPAMRGMVFAGKRDIEDIHGVVQLGLTDVVMALDKPLVVLFDEADCLGGQTLISFLRQLRDGYINRGTIPFVHSLALVGMRNIRDFKAQVRPDSQTLGSASPFNIATEAMSLRSFSQAEIAALYEQHTKDTGQVIPPEAVETAFHYSQGQPWLVNALAREVIEKTLENDFSRTVEADMFARAAERLILRRDTHLDSLLERLKEPRVRKIIAPMLMGEVIEDRTSDDFRYVHDLGLIRVDKDAVRPANPIYQEVIARTLTATLQEYLPPALMRRWVGPEEVQVTELLQEFQRYWRANSDILGPMVPYTEAVPQMILQAFLQRVLNGGAWIAREYATGSRRVDLCIEYGKMRYPIEIKVRRAKSGDVRDEGVEQLSAYMDTLGQTEGWLAIFDQRPEVSWDEKIVWEDTENAGKTIHIVGL